MRFKTVHVKRLCYNEQEVIYVRRISWILIILFGKKVRQALLRRK